MALPTSPLQGRLPIVKDKLLVLVPTRGRPHNAQALRDAFDSTQATADLLFVIDKDDPTFDGYDATNIDYILVENTTRGMAYPLNEVAKTYAEHYKYICFMGDDHRPRTHKWDDKLISKLQEAPALAYGNDLFQGQSLPTMIAMTSDIVTALGGMVPPNMRHLYLDNFWLRLGTDLGKITYCPEIIIEHCHPLIGKAEMDEGYKTVNAAEVYTADRDAFNNFINSFMYKQLLEKLK